MLEVPADEAVTDPNTASEEGPRDSTGSRVIRQLSKKVFYNNLDNNF